MWIYGFINLGCAAWWHEICVNVCKGMLSNFVCIFLLLHLQLYDQFYVFKHSLLPQKNKNSFWFYLQDFNRKIMLGFTSGECNI